jgi:peptidoglycan/LPS O-acetylase OafA/YrhL
MNNKKLCSEIQKFFKSSKIFSLTGWFLTLGFFWFKAFGISTFNLSWLEEPVYRPIFRELWACAVCWIIFACHNLKTGGFIRTFLSHRFWQPLSKLTLSMYLLHMPYLLYTKKYHKTGFGILWFSHIILGDVSLTIIFAIAAYVIIECPVEKLLDLGWKTSNQKKVEAFEEKVPLLENSV